MPPRDSLAPSLTQPRTSVLSLGVATVFTGIGAGLAGMLLALLLHEIQHLAFAYGLPHESFLQGVTAASAMRRAGVLLVCGLVAGLGWWAVYRYGRPLVSVKAASKLNGPEMPAGSTLAHALLQIITVALGSPLGREVAPREAGALFASKMAGLWRLDPQYRQWLIACGAGAGLAAVYNVPLAGALFVMEVLLVSFDWRVALMALVTSTLGASVAWLGLGAESQYVVAPFATQPGLIFWAILAGPVCGFAAVHFTRLTSAARADAPRGWKLPVLCIINFGLIGLLSISWPQLLGNGKGPAQLSFDGHLSMTVVVSLLILRVIITASTLRAGAEGGLLTPGLANGALLALILGLAWNAVGPALPLGACAIIGAAAFLGTSMSMPLTATVLLAEFTRVPHDFFVPMALAVAGAYATGRWLSARA